MFASLVSQLPQFWIGRLAHYGLHRNDEHFAALFEEAVRYTGLHLENDLAASAYWSNRPLHHRAIVVLFLVDRGLVNRTIKRRTARVRTTSARRVVGGKPALPTSLPEANARDFGRVTTRTAQAFAFAPWL